jgi:hypothetical protein
MSNIDESRRAVIARILEGEGKASPAQRRAAFGAESIAGPLGVLVEKVATRAHQIGDEDIAAVRNAGLSEDEVFELVVCAAVGQATRQYETARAALAAALKKE